MSEDGRSWDEVLGPSMMVHMLAFNPGSNASGMSSFVRGARIFESPGFAFEFLPCLRGIVVLELLASVLPSSCGRTALEGLPGVGKVGQWYGSGPGGPRGLLLPELGYGKSPRSRPKTNPAVPSSCRVGLISSFIMPGATLWGGRYEKSAWLLFDCVPLVNSLHKISYYSEFYSGKTFCLTVS